MTLTETTTRTLEVPGATLTYDVRPGPGDAVPLFLVGLPMAAAGFGTLAGHFPDRTVVTHDPRGSERSTKADPTARVTVDTHADDLHRLIQELDAGPVDLFGSSGGAAVGLALVAAHPEDVRTLVAHEPPLASILPDRENALAASRAVGETYEAKGFGAGMAHFIAVVSHRGEFPDGWADQPAPDPALFGLPAEDDGSRNDPLMGSGNMLITPAYEPDVEALRRASTRIVPAAGNEVGTMANRAAHALAERLGLQVVVFPGGHGGFLGGEYGQMGEPDAFAAKLRDVLEA
ncbi:MAG TPA: alpha/beta hydrolase [candidate division Zixibacteria bacterium]|nr:alpha/beta hydrolase [candidate division Zixibacteria bacterium]